MSEENLMHFHIKLILFPKKKNEKSIVAHAKKKKKKKMLTIFSSSTNASTYLEKEKIFTFSAVAT